MSAPAQKALSPAPVHDDQPHCRVGLGGRHGDAPPSLPHVEAHGVELVLLVEREPRDRALNGIMHLACHGMSFASQLVLVARRRRDNRSTSGR
jgi:hypothetical protein